MAFDTTAWALKQRDLKTTTKLVLIQLSSFRNKATNQCNPSQRTLSNACGLSVSTINKHLRILEDLGLIRRERQFDPRSGAARSTWYFFPKSE